MDGIKNNYSNSFTCEMLEEIVASNKNTVVSYPAGTGKTTAIVEYICKNAKNRNRIIYIAPTKSLLDDLYNKLIAHGGLMWNDVFLYHSSSQDYLTLKSKYGDTRALQQAIDLRIETSSVVLITHNRMMFEDYHRFSATDPIRYSEGILGSRSCTEVFIDEAVQPCLFATINKLSVACWLKDAGLVAPGCDVLSYDPSQKTDDWHTELTNRTRDIYKSISSATYTRGDELYLHSPSKLGIKLSNDCGFEGNVPAVILNRRLKNLYLMIAMQLALGKFEIDADDYVIELPVALQLVWRDALDCKVIIMDATAKYSKSLYEGYKLVDNISWNFDKLTNYVYHSKYLTKTNLFLNPKPEVIKSILDTIPFDKYNQIYLVTFKAALPMIYDYIKTYKPEFNIVYREDNEQLLISDIDTSTDDGYELESGKTIYLTNYGRTRGSNIFRECDCVIQFGAYRFPSHVINLIKLAFNGFNENDLPIANFFQELYRGRIRCDLPMDSYSILDNNLYEEICERTPDCKFIEVDLKNINIHSLDDYLMRNPYGNGPFVQKLVDYMKDHDSITVELLKEFSNISHLNTLRRKLLSINQVEEIHESLFNSYDSNDDLLLDFNRGVVKLSAD